MTGAVHQLRPGPAETAEPRKRIRTKILFQREKFAAIINDLGSLWRLHDKELWPDRSWGRLAPDNIRYLTLEQQGVLHVITARTGAGRLIGYCFEIVTMDLHYSETKSSINDTIFLHPDYRVGKGLSLRRQPGVRLLKERERMLDELKVARRRIGFKLWQQAGPIMARLFGYKAEAVFYHKAATPEDDDA